MTWIDKIQEIARQSLEAEDGLIHELPPATRSVRRILTEARNRRTSNQRNYYLS